MEKEKTQKTLLEEMVQGLTDDVTELKQQFANQPKPTTLLDARSTLEKVAGAINGLRSQIETFLKDQDGKPKPSVQAVESNEILTELRAMRQDIRRSPANQISKAVRYGAALLALSLVLTGVLAYYASKWRAERDAFEVSDWKWRAVHQDAEEYATKMDGDFGVDSTAARYKSRIVEMEQADAAREVARRAAEQAKTMNAQADQLEGKKAVNSKRK